MPRRPGEERGARPYSRSLGRTCTCTSSQACTVTIARAQEAQGLRGGPASRRGGPIWHLSPHIFPVHAMNTPQPSRALKIATSGVPNVNTLSVPGALAWCLGGSLSLRSSPPKPFSKEYLVITGHGQSPRYQTRAAAEKERPPSLPGKAEYLLRVDFVCGEALRQGSVDSSSPLEALTRSF